MLPKPYFYDARFLGGAVVVPFLGGGLLLRCFKLVPCCVVDKLIDVPPMAPLKGELLSEREAEGVQLDEWGCYEPTHDTLSVSPFGLPALPEGEPRALRAATVV